MCGAKLNFWQAESIISFLLANGHLELSRDENGVTQYVTTAKGEQLRDFIRRIQEEIGGLFIRASSSSTLSTSHVSATQLASGAYGRP